MQEKLQTPPVKLCASYQSSQGNLKGSNLQVQSTYLLKYTECGELAKAVSIQGKLRVTLHTEYVTT